MNSMILGAFFGSIITLACIYSSLRYRIEKLERDVKKLEKDIEKLIENN